jgi:hypothetical protein
VRPCPQRLACFSGEDQGIDDYEVSICEVSPSGLTACTNLTTELGLWSKHRVNLGRELRNLKVALLAPAKKSLNR